MHVCLKTVSINVANTEQYQLICKPGSFTELLLIYVAFSALFLKFKSKPSIDYEVFVSLMVEFVCSGVTQLIHTVLI